MKKVVPNILILLSGFAGLVYQLLWMRQLGLLFGNTAHAAAATLSIFFGGLAVGSWFWGKRSAAGRNPLRTYAWLEVGIAVTALLYFGVIALFRVIYPQIYQGIGPGPVLFLVKCLLAVILVFPPAFFMGGTMPAMGQYLVSNKNLFGTTVARIYGINTVGAALGAGFAAFIFIPRFGFRLTCIGAIALSSCVAGVAFWFSMGCQESTSLPEEDKKAAEETDRGEAAGPARWVIFFLAFLSGFSVLALEVLWTRMFAQIHENSVYSFATVLVIVLVCLSVGAFAASLLARIGCSKSHSLSLLMIIGGAVLALSPLLFMDVTDSFLMLPTDGSFAEYVRKLFAVGFTTIGPACLVLGMLFPFLMKSEERFADCPGKSVGYLSAVNTVGAIIGSLLCGFLFLRVLGIWWTVQAIAGIYLLVGILLPVGFKRDGLILRTTGAIFLVLVFTVLNPSKIPATGVDPARGRYDVVEVWETSDCSVVVVTNTQGTVAIKLNSNYVLGSTEAIDAQVLQARVPLFIWPNTESIFFLGMGTGITAGGALDSMLFKSVKRVVVCEMVPEVVEAAERYMGGGNGSHDHTAGLFTDPRVQILVEDGRQYLMASDESFDMINADLFLPYRSGAGSLYSREHFESAKKRLNPGGVFVQWLPLFQLTDHEFGTIARTMLSVFDQVTLWRNGFAPGMDIVALVGHNGTQALPSCALDISEAKRAAIQESGLAYELQYPLFCNEQGVAIFYCGNVSASRAMFDDYPINTDDKPIIEYAAPISMRKESGDALPPTLVGPRLVNLVDRLMANCHPSHDPVLAGRTAENRRLPLAGAALYRSLVGFGLRDEQMCSDAWEVFIREWTNQGAGVRSQESEVRGQHR